LGQDDRRYKPHKAESLFQKCLQIRNAPCPTGAKAGNLLALFGTTEVMPCYESFFLQDSYDRVNCEGATPILSDRCCAPSLISVPATATSAIRARMCGCNTRAGWGTVRCPGRSRKFHWSGSAHNRSLETHGCAGASSSLGCPPACADRGTRHHSGP